ncbi:SixA phosphatase family protein [Aquimarina addita]
MKTLYIIRHAKSSWEYDVEDRNRPLNERGVNDAGLIGKKLISLINPVDQVLCSDAKRTQMTADIVLSHLTIDRSVFSLEPKLYDFDGHQVIEVIKSCSNQVSSLMIFGHNHALTSIVNMFGSEIIYNLPTAGVVAIHFDVEEWQNISVGKNLFTLFPKELR